MPSRDINDVMEAHAEELMKLPGVTGVAVGETDEGAPCVLVLILDDREDYTRRIPTSLEGYPVRTLVSGEIRPMQDSL